MTKAINLLVLKYLLVRLILPSDTIYIKNSKDANQQIIVK